MNLKRRLERLAGATASGPPESGVVATAPAPAALGADRQRTLEELRRQMSALLARGEPSPPRPVAQAFGWQRAEPALRLEDLPFVERRSPCGSYFQRVERLSSAERVGSVAVEAAGRADPAVLAELALDPGVAASPPQGWLFIDTEATGLGGGGALVFLVGLASIEPSGEVVVEQLLMAEPNDELALLERLAERVAASSMLVSFNGKAFDRPLLDGRYVLNRMPPLPPRAHLDLLHVGRRLHRRRVGRCTLKRMESEVLGFDRGDDIEGSEVGAIYSHFLRSSDATGLNAVVTHNYWDVVSMVALVGLYGQRTPPLVGEDLAGLARTLERAGASAHAERVADIACERGGGPEAYRIRAELAKSRGDSSRAVRDFELLCRQADDPRARLELAKLYEHKLRQPARALEWLRLGTNEENAASARRRERLERKLRRDSSP